MSRASFALGATLAAALILSTNALAWEWSGQGDSYRSCVTDWQERVAQRHDAVRARGGEGQPLVDGHIRLTDLLAHLPAGIVSPDDDNAPLNNRPSAGRGRASRPHTTPTPPVRTLTVAALIERDQKESLK